MRNQINVLANREIRNAKVAYQILKHTNALFLPIVAGFKKCLDTRLIANSSVTTAPYPFFLLHDCRFAVLAEKLGAIMHHTPVIIREPKRVNTPNDVEIELGI